MPVHSTLQANEDCKDDPKRDNAFPKTGKWNRRVVFLLARLPGDRVVAGRSRRPALQLRRGAIMSLSVGQLLSRSTNSVAGARTVPKDRRRELAANRIGASAMTIFPLSQLEASRIRGHKAGLLSGYLPALMLAAALAATSASAASNGEDGYYTMAQANAGGETYEHVCAICHGDHMQGQVGPALKGEQFLSASQFQGLTGWTLYYIMSHNMPQNNPGSLSQKQYTDLLAFVLNENGYPSGNTALKPTQENLQSIKIEPQTGHSEAIGLSQ